RMRASAMNRIFGLLTQWGLRVSLKRLRERDAMTLLERRGVPLVWRRSIAEALDVIELLDARIGPLDAELGPPARADTPGAPPAPNPRSRAPTRASRCWTPSPASAPCSDSRSRLRSATSRASARHANSSATRAWRRRSARAAAE